MESAFSNADNARNTAAQVQQRRSKDRGSGHLPIQGDAGCDRKARFFSLTLRRCYVYHLTVQNDGSTLGRRSPVGAVVGRAQLCLLHFAIALSLVAPAMAAPWDNPLMIARSSDGVNFMNPAVFQDSGGVPSAICWGGDTLICVFQWCHPPVGGPTWDKVAVKLSYDRGANWTYPQPIVVNSLPPTFQRPFDPTIARFSDDSVRIYFSSSDGMPPPGGDSIINTYSAATCDGINYYFESGPRVDYPTQRVIDPAVIYFHNAWHYTSPKGAPQDGAFHYVSPDGVNFSQVPDIVSDPAHNWTGNFVVEDTGELRFYGCGPTTWYNYSANGGVWNGYVNTNLQGGDPSVVKLDSNDYLMIYTGQPYAGIVNRHGPLGTSSISVSPNPAPGVVRFDYHLPAAIQVQLLIYDAQGRIVRHLIDGTQPAGTHSVTWFGTTDRGTKLPGGLYFYRLQAGSASQTGKIPLLRGKLP